MIPDMEKILRSAIKDLEQTQVYINRIPQLSDRMYASQLVQQIQTALNVCLINVKEIILKGKEIDTRTSIELAREEIEVISRKQNVIKEITENIQKKQKELEEYHKQFAVIFQILWEEKNGRQENKHHN